MKKSFIILGIVVLTLMTSLVAYAVAWPTSLTRHSDIMMSVTPYEPSGLVWNPVTNKLFSVCNTGQVTMMNLDGTEQSNVKAPSYADYEAIAIADPASKKVYIGVENPDSIIEYDWTAGVGFTGKTWDLRSVMDGADNSGLEGLTFVPNGYHPYDESASGGLFYTAIQRAPVLTDAVTYNDYLIYAFDIDLSTSGKIVKWWGIPVAPSTPTSDVSDMYFSKDTGVLYVLYDGSNRLIEMKTDGTVIADYSGVPVNNQEGVVVKTSYPSLTADIYLGSDSDLSIGWFSGYAVNYDVDKDGVENSLDCAVNNSSLSVKKTYYQDLDKDGLGSDVSTSVCSLVAPAGYVTNSDDTDDSYVGNPNDKDNDGVVAGVDCNDNDASISANKTYYQDLDKDGLGADVSTSVCSLVAPAGYVTNSDDTDDDYVGNPNDKDNDGVVASLDCNDNDASISAKKTYYQDLDKDGLGSDVSTSVCSLVAPTGYVTNSDDVKDNDKDNDGVITSKDCNDSNPLYYTKKFYYGDADGDGYGSWMKMTYTCVPPSGYVTNGKDRNDKNPAVH